MLPHFGGLIEADLCKNTCFAAFLDLYKICSRVHRSKAKTIADILSKINMFANIPEDKKHLFAKFCYTLKIQLYVFLCRYKKMQNAYNTSNIFYGTDTAKNELKTNHF